MMRAMERCDHCDLLIGAGCACTPRQRTASGTTGLPSSGGSPDSGFPPGAILISPRRVAHRPGCTHQSDSQITPPAWGWILDPDPHLWRRISATHPARATHGNTDRYAVRRCRDCDS